MAESGDHLELRLVHKAEYNQQLFIPAPVNKLPPLAPSSVRVKTSLIGLTANNLSYCSLGSILHWWDTFPVPLWVEQQSIDPTQYGISPGWGYGTILESNVPSLSPGTLLYGFLPISSFPVDLLLSQSKILSNHYDEVSEHRKLVMPLYQRYIAVPDEDLSTPEAALRVMLKIVFDSAFLYNMYNFPSDPNIPTLHPGIGHAWNKQDGDLREAIVICLGAGSKTSRSFVHQLASNRLPGSGPVAVLEVSSTSSPFSTRKLPFAHKLVSYDELKDSQSANWIFSQPVKKIVLIDFAGRKGTCQDTYTMLKSHPSALPIEVVMVGAAPKVYTLGEVKEREALTSRLNAVRCNASAIRMAAIEAEGEKKFYERQGKAFDDFLHGEKSLQQGAYVGIEIIPRKGLSGDLGIEGVWKSLCEGGVRGDQGFAFSL